MAEVLVVVALVGIVLAVIVPLAADNIRKAKIRAAADVFGMSLRAAAPRSQSARFMAR